MDFYFLQSVQVNFTIGVIKKINLRERSIYTKDLTVSGKIIEP